LRETYNIKLTLENLFLSYFLARNLCNIFKVIEYFSQRWDPDFNAFDFSACSLFNDLFEVDVSWVYARISKSVEDCSWYPVGYPFSCILDFFGL